MNLIPIDPDEGWAMRRLQRRRSVGLRPEPQASRRSRATATIAGALRDPLGLSVVGMIGLLAVLA